MSYYQNPPMPRRRIEQLTRKQIKMGSRVGAYVVGFNATGYVIVHDTRGLVGTSHKTIEAARAEMRILAEVGA